jgi:hypothetical protein
MARISAALDRKFKKEVQSLTVNLSKRVRTIAVIVTDTRCANCVYDQVHKSGTGVYKEGGPQPFTGKVCPVCENQGFTTSELKRTVAARVVFGQAGHDDPNRVSVAGVVPNGHALLKVVIKDQNTLIQADYFLLNGVRYKAARREDGKNHVVTSGLLTNAIAELLAREDL